MKLGVGPDVDSIGLLRRLARRITERCSFACAPFKEGGDGRWQQDRILRRDACGSWRFS